MDELFTQTMDIYAMIYIFYDFELQHQDIQFMSRQDQSILNLILSGFDPFIHDKNQISIIFKEKTLKLAPYLDQEYVSFVKNVNETILNDLVQLHGGRIYNDTIIVHFAGKTKNNLRCVKNMDTLCHRIKQIMIDSTLNCHPQFIKNISNI